ncbi:MAG: YhcB family protein [Colwellia sp.]|nr:YhcB family protein [Colwellia sp.]MCW9082293.1 YhcB family protein [Colwellia sp.]
MTVVTALIIFVVGSIVGFFVNHFLSSSNQEQRKLAEQVNKSEAALAQYKLDVSDHLASSAKLLEQMNSTCQTAMKQMEESTQLLQKATTTDVEGMPFFSQETQQQLAQTAGLRHPKRSSKNVESATEAPLDYSGQASGLFIDEKQRVSGAE